MTATTLLRQLADRGVELFLDGQEVRYRGPRREITPAVLATLKARKDEIRGALVQRDRRAAHLKTRPVAELLAHLANQGFWFRLDEDGWPWLQEHCESDRDGVDEAVIDELAERMEELAAFLRKTEDEMTDEELNALGYRRARAGGPVLVDCDEPSEVGYAPPAGQEVEA